MNDASPTTLAAAGTFADFGAAVRHEFALDFAAAHLNHGSFGATPRVVLAEQDRWRARMEREIGAFFMHDRPALLRAAAARLAAYIGAAGEDVVFVDNATTGAMAVLGSLTLAPGDEILVTSQTYGAVAKIARHVAARAGAQVAEAALPFPVEDPAEIVGAVTRALSPRTRLAVLDHIASPTAVAMPLAALIAACRAAGARVLVDGAHAPGMVPLDLPALGADWYTGNGHKWLCAAKGCAFLWARRPAQDGLHPAMISHGYGEGFVAEFDWTGTRDLSPALSLGAALDFRARYGDARIMAHNRALAGDAAQRLVRRWGTNTGMPPALAGSMTMVALPARFRGDQAAAVALRRRLWDEARIDVLILALAGNFWARLSAQIYNTMEDYDRLGSALDAL